MNDRAVTDEILNMVIIFDLSKLETYGERLTDNVIFSLIVDKPQLFIPLEKYIKDESLYYRILDHILKRHSSELLNILIKEKISKKMEIIIINMIHHPHPKDRDYCHLASITKPNESFVYVHKKEDNLYYSFLNIFPIVINLLILSKYIVANTEASYLLLTTIKESMIEKLPYSLTREHMKNVITKHPNFSAAKAILKGVEDTQ